MEEMRDPSVAVLSGLCPAVSTATFLIGAVLLVRKGLRAAPFCGSVLAIILWYLVREGQLVFSSTLIVIVSIQRLKVFAEAGLADWLTDRRLRVILASFLVVRVVFVTQFIRAYAKMDPGQPWDVPLERLMLSTLIIGGDAMIDLVCTVVAFILVLRVRVAVIHARERRASVKLQWQFTTELVKNHKAKTIQVSPSGTGPDTKVGLSVNAKSLLDLPRLLSKRTLPSPVIPLLGTSGETMPQGTTTLDTTTTARTSADGLPVVGAANG
ncbi:hypothetical protein GGF32_005375 [Allomyces javanicus]|nr:hypothetical protein GGF32_005375 [Allomyces javanicus]